MSNYQQKLILRQKDPDFLQDWEHAVEDAYYHLRVTLPNYGKDFIGNIECWHLPTVSLSRLQSTSIVYERLKINQAMIDDSFLMAISLEESIHYATNSSSGLEFRKGQYVLQHCSEKYRFECRKSANMWVIRLPGKALRQVISNPEKLCGYNKQPIHNIYSDFLMDYLKLAHPNNLCAVERNEAFLRMVEQQIIDICLSILQQDYVNAASPTVLIEQVHIHNIKKQALLKLSDPDLKPEQLAKDNRISIRYFYALFQNNQESFHKWLNTERLKKAHYLLINQPHNTILHIALQCGFSNQSHFAQCFKKEFGVSPSAIRQKGTEGK